MSSGRHGSCNSRGRARETFELVGEVASGLETILRLLLQAMPDETVERGGDLGVRRKLGRLFGQDRVQRPDRRVLLESTAAGQQLVEDGAQREEVRTGSAASPRTCSGDMYPAVPITVPGSVSASPSRSLRSPSGPARSSRARPKSRIFTIPSFVRNRFSGLRSRWTIPFRGRRRGPGELQGVLDGLANGQRTGVQPLAQRLAFQQLRDQIGRALVVAHVVDGQDVRVVEKAGGAGLLLEPWHGTARRQPRRAGP